MRQQIYVSLVGKNWYKGERFVKEENKMVS